MSTVRDLITRAGRIIQEVNEGARAPVAYLGSEVGLTAFNALMREMRGVQIGQRLRRSWNASAGDTACAGGLYNVNVTTPCEPANGDRIGVLGARTVTADEDTIEGAASVTTTESTSWFYREDLADWLKEEDATLDDDSPLSGECDESLACMIAARMYLEQFGEITPSLAKLNENGRAKIGQLYRARVVVRADNAVLRGLAQRNYG